MKPANESWTRDQAGMSSLPDDLPPPASVKPFGASDMPFPAGDLPLDAAPPAAPTSSAATPDSLQSTVSLLAGYAILITGNGLLGTLISLRLIQQQTPSIVVGIVQSAYYVGFLVGALWGGVLIGRVGHHRAFVSFAAASACCALGYPLWSEAAVWVALRFITGFCLVGIFTVVESWLHAVASNAQRGRVFSAYLITNYLGVGTGQFLIGLADTSSFVLFSVVSALFSASLIPVALANTAPVAHADHDSPTGTARLALGYSGLRTAFRLAPLGAFGCLAAGMLNSGFYTMQPVFMRHVGYPVADVAHFMGFALLAALLPQWPVARLADRFDRRLIMLGIALLSGTCSVLLFLFHSGAFAEAIGYLYVSVVFSLYGVVTSYVNDSIPASQRIAVSAGLLMIFAIGASCGPTLASAMMGLTGPAGLYLFTAIVTGTLATLTLRSLRAGRVAWRLE
jgi:MFS family permease